MCPKTVSTSHYSQDKWDKQRGGWEDHDLENDWGSIVQCDNHIHSVGSQ